MQVACTCLRGSLGHLGRKKPTEDSAKDGEANNNKTAFAIVACSMLTG